MNNLLENINIEILIDKLTFYFGEEIKYNIKTKIKYTYYLQKFDLKQNIYRKIQWIGYMKNSLLDKSIYAYKRTCNAKYKEEDDPFLYQKDSLLLD